MKKMSKKKQSDKTFYGIVKVSHNGQVIIPADLRKELEIDKGDQLIVVRSKDGEDIILVKMEKLERILSGTTISDGFRELSK